MCQKHSGINDSDIKDLGVALEGLTASWGRWLNMITVQWVHIQRYGSLKELINHWQNDIIVWLSYHTQKTKTPKDETSSLWGPLTWILFAVQEHIRFASVPGHWHPAFTGTNELLNSEFQVLATCSTHHIAFIHLLPMQETVTDSYLLSPAPRLLSPTPPVLHFSWLLFLWLQTATCLSPLISFTWAGFPVHPHSSLSIYHPSSWVFRIIASVFM